MRHAVARWFAVTISAVSMLCGVARAQSVTTYHAAANRSGHYVVEGLTWAQASGLHLDPKFTGQVDGNLYAQPLYWQDARIIVALSSQPRATTSTRSMPPPARSYGRNCSGSR